MFDNAILLSDGDVLIFNADRTISKNSQVCNSNGVDLEDNRLAIGGENAGELGFESGAAYVYDENMNAWRKVMTESDFIAAAGGKNGSTDEEQRIFDQITGANADGTAAYDLYLRFVEGASFEFGVNVKSYSFADSGVAVHSVSTADLNLSSEAMNAVNGIETTGITKANGFDRSAARLTYTEDIILQIGLRAKDSVGYTFKYNADDSADMGGLKANLDLSAHVNGLNTANLSLANQVDANYTVDRIDKAINRVSMVRSTFARYRAGWSTRSPTLPYPLRILPIPSPQSATPIWRRR